MKTRIHAIAGAIALVLVSCFWSSTVIAELWLSPEAVATVKHAIVYGVALLIPAMIVAGGSGFLLGRSRRGTLVDGKKRRMRFIGMNGMLVLAPAAFFLHSKATAAEFDALFYAVQAVELVAGAVQLALLGGNFRDGLRLAGRLRSFSWRAFGSAQCARTRREGLIALLKGDDDANLR